MAVWCSLLIPAKDIGKISVCRIDSIAELSRRSSHFGQDVSYDPSLVILGHEGDLSPCKSVEQVCVKRKREDPSSRQLCSRLMGLREEQSTHSTSFDSFLVGCADYSSASPSGRPHTLSG